jgi:transcriptional regulator with XRE-family HTH domain
MHHLDFSIVLRYVFRRISMAWVAIRGAVRKLREAAKLEQRELAKKSGLTERAIRLYESKRAPKTMYATSVKALAGALGCVPEDLARWVTRPRNMDDADDDAITTALALPPPSTLARRASRERELGRDGEIVTARGQSLPLVGPTLLKRCHAACATVAGQRFAVAGVVQDYEPLPARAAAVLDVAAGVGTRFLLARNVARGVPFYATVFTRELAHTERLLAAGEAKARITAIVEVVVREAAGDWKGFFIFEKRPKPHPFCFLVRDLL